MPVMFRAVPFASEARKSLCKFSMSVRSAKPRAPTLTFEVVLNGMAVEETAVVAFAVVELPFEVMPTAVVRLLLTLTVVLAFCPRPAAPVAAVELVDDDDSVVEGAPVEVDAVDVLVLVGFGVVPGSHGYT